MIATAEPPEHARPRPHANGAATNRLLSEDRSAHDWYRFVLSFPPHLVRYYLDRFGVAGGGVVLDPFAGTGTTLVECKKQGIGSVGIEPHPMSHLAARVKTEWAIDADRLAAVAEATVAEARSSFEADGILDDFDSSLMAEPKRLRSLPPETARLLLKDSISSLPLHKALVLRDALSRRSREPGHAHLLLALARVLVRDAGNLHFGPEVGVTAPKSDAPVLRPWLAQVQQMAGDLRRLSARRDVPCEAIRADAREVAEVLKPQSIDAVICSPPYPNEKDYTRTTRLETVVLGLLTTRAELKAAKQLLLRSNTRNVYKNDGDDAHVRANARITLVADQIEARRIEMGKTSGFERMYHRVTRLYFGGMARHLAGLRGVLKPGAQLAYVVGDQASFLRVMIRTGEILADLAIELGYEVVGIDLFRERYATATREMLREEVVVLRWPGEAANRNGATS